MLSCDKNDLLTRVGPETSMGNYLRRYWHPVAGASEFDEVSIKPIRLLGEDLVLYKDLSGNFGLVERHCPHRRADMVNGYVETQGIRCSYHGWQFDLTGQCIHQPYEDVVSPEGRLRKNTQTRAYPVREKAGMLWVYMGPAPAPLIPDWDIFNLPNGFAQVVLSTIPCNWFQTQENSIDPVHFEWTHNNWSMRLAGRTGPYVGTHLKLQFEEFEHGFVYKRLRAGEPEDSTLWTVGRVALWPHGFFLGEHFEYRIPIDDENTLSVRWSFCRVPMEQEPYVQKRIPTWHGPIKDAAGQWITSHVGNQDFIVWVGQGTIADRTKEKLGQSDQGIAMMRRRFFEELEALARDPAFEPKGLLRDPAKNVNLELPSVCREELRSGLPAAELEKHPVLGPYLTDFISQAGMPESVQKEYEAAIGRRLKGERTFRLHGSRT